MTPNNLLATYSLWTIPGDAIKNYEQSMDAGVVTPLSASDLESPQISYYWISGGANLGDCVLKVTYDVMIDGREFSAETEFCVLRPTATLTSTTTFDEPPVDVWPAGYPGGDPTRLGFGYVWNGITWNAQITTPAGGSGLVAFTQLAATDVQFTVDDTSGTKEKRSSGGKLLLDTVPQYRYRFQHVDAGSTSPFSDSDSPFEELLSTDKHVDRNDAFQLYFVYRPDGAGSIWVTLCELDWHWGGAATKDQLGAWSLDSGSAGSSVNPVGTDSTKPPEWDGRVQDLRRGPV